ncbi:MAG: hypothetical protein AAGI34_06615 [Pseudomonadota bacterium]
MPRTAHLAALPPNQLCLICRHVFLGERAIAYIEPTEEGILVAACGEDDHGDGPEDWLSVGFGTLIERDPGLAECPPIPLGQAAVRTEAGTPWRLEAVATEEAE